MRIYKVKNEAGQAFEVDEDKLHEAEKDGFLPVVSNGQQEHRVSPQDFAAAEKDGYKPVFELDVSQLESGARGAAQGASLGFVDELVGAGKAMYDDISKMFQGEKSGVVPKYDEFGRVTNLDEINQGLTYEKHREEYRKADKEAQEANPNTYLAGNVAGSVATSFVPGAGLLNAGKGAGLITQIGKGALQGGLVGLGTSDADLTEGDIKGAAIDTAAGAAIGGALPIAIKGVGIAAKKMGVSDKSKAVRDYLTNKVKKIPDTFAKHVLDLPEEAIEAIKRDETLLPASKTAKTVFELTDTLDDGMAITRKTVSALDNKAWEELDKLDSPIQKPLERFQDDFSNIGERLLEELNISDSSQGAQRSAEKAVRDAMNDAKKVATFKDLKKLVQGIDENTNWDNPSDNLKNKALQYYRTELDRVLKFYKPYENAMKPVADKTAAINQVKNRLSLKNSVGVDGEKALLPSDRTPGRLQSLVKEGLDPRKNSILLNNLENVAPGMSQDIRSAALKNAMQVDTARGSRSAAVGGLAGVLGNAWTIATGGVVGYARDKFGRRVGAEIIQRLNHGGFKKFVDGSNAAAEKYAPVLINAAAKGANNLAVTHQILLKKDEVYRSLFDESQEE